MPLVQYHTMPYIYDVNLPLSCTEKHFPSYHPHYSYASASLPEGLSLNSISLMGSHNGAHASSASPNFTVAQALEIARDYLPGQEHRDPQVVRILDNAIAEIWAKLQAQPQSYVLTRDEFAVFNFFQHLFEDEPIALAARKRFWDTPRV